MGTESTRRRAVFGTCLTIAFILSALVPALATTLVLDFRGNGSPNQFSAEFFDGTAPILVTHPPWSITLPNIPDGQWQIALRLHISFDTTQSAASPQDLEIPIRFSRYHRQIFQTMTVPVYLMTDAPDINNTLATSLEGPTNGENEKVIDVFKARYAYLRVADRNGPFGLRILRDYLGLAQAYGQLFRYVTIADDVVDLANQARRATDDAKRQDAQQVFKSWTDTGAGQRGVSGLDLLRYEAWDDLALATSVAMTRPLLTDEHDKCIMITFYLAKFDAAQPAQEQQIITRRLGFSDATWAALRSAASLPPCKAAKPPA